MKLLTRPPVTNASPMDFLTSNSYKLLVSHQKAFTGKRGDTYDRERAKWNKDTLHMVGVLRKKLLAAGFIVEFINEHDELVFGVLLKSAVQVKIDKNAEQYHERGLELAGGDVPMYLQQMRGVADAA